MKITLSKTIVCVCVCVFCHFANYAQSELTYTEKSEMVQASQSIVLKENITNAALEYGKVNQYNLKNIEKNFIHLKVIFNEDLPLKKRVDYCSYLLDLFSGDPTIFSNAMLERVKNNLRKKLVNE